MSTRVLSLFAGGALVVTFALALSGGGANAAPGGSYVGESVDLGISADAKVSMGYTVASPRDGCASTVQAFALPISAAGGFRVDNNAGLGILAGRVTPNEAFTIVGAWDGFAQVSAAGVITSEPAAGSNCLPVRKAWRAIASGSPLLGANLFEGATGPVTVIGRPTASGSVTLSMNAKGDSLSSFSVNVQDGACNYAGTSFASDFPPGGPTPLTVESSSFFGSSGFGMLSGVTVLGGARGGLVLQGKDACPTIGATYTAIVAGGTLAPMPAPTTSTPAATPTPTGTATATPAATATPVATVTVTPAAVTPRFAGTPVFGTGGQAFAVFTGGTSGDLEAQAKAAGASGIWVQTSGGAYQLLVVDGPVFLNAAFRAAFAAGLAVNTPVTLTR